METHSHHGERQTQGCLGLIRSLKRGPWCAIVVNVFRIVLMERVLLKRMIVTSANGRFVLRMPCFFPLLSWYGEDLSLRRRALIMLLPRCSLRGGQQVPGRIHYLMVAAFIFFTITQSTVGESKRTVQSYFPPFMRVQWLEKSADVSRFPPGAPQLVWGQVASASLYRQKLLR